MVSVSSCLWRASTRTLAHANSCHNSSFYALYPVAYTWHGHCRNTYYYRNAHQRDTYRLVFTGTSIAPSNWALPQAIHGRWVIKRSLSSASIHFTPAHRMTIGNFDNLVLPARWHAPFTVYDDHCIFYPRVDHIIENHKSARL